MKLISMGAEAQIYLKGNTIIKRRVKKGYRIDEIDDPLRKTRTRTEAKILKRLKDISPELISADDKNMEIVMKKIDGQKVRDILEKNTDLALQIGRNIALMHNLGIIHGDLTTSNMIYYDKVYFIDFGLSFFSDKKEDKAVDLHLLRQALESKHPKIWQEAYGKVIDSYEKEAKDHKNVLKRLEKVENRGRNKAK